MLFLRALTKLVWTDKAWTTKPPSISLWNWAINNGTLHAECRGTNMITLPYRLFKSLGDALTEQTHNTLGQALSSTNMKATRGRVSLHKMPTHLKWTADVILPPCHLHGLEDQSSHLNHSKGLLIVLGINWIKDLNSKPWLSLYCGYNKIHR